MTGSNGRCGSLRAASVLAAWALVAASCGASVTGSTVRPAATSEPLEQWFGPSFPPRPPSGPRVGIDSASLSADKRTLTITFSDGSGYSPSNPCSEDYEPWLGVDGQMLDVTVVQVARPGQVTLPPNFACAGVGLEHTYHLALAIPFAGTTVNELSGGTLFVAAPAGQAEPRVLPPGWALRRSFGWPPGIPPVWVRVYAAADVSGAGPVEGPGRLVVYQAFGSSDEWSGTRAEKARERGAVQLAVSVNGTREVLWRDAVSGELLLSWTLGGQSLALVGNTADMTADELVDIAQGFAPGP